MSEFSSDNEQKVYRALSEAILIADDTMTEKNKEFANLLSSSIFRVDDTAFVKNQNELREYLKDIEKTMKKDLESLL